MEFRSQYMVLFFVPLVLAGALALLRRRPALLFSSLGKRRRARRAGTRTRLTRLPALLLVASGTLLVIALAGPRRGIEIVHKETEGVDIALCLDVSGSMQERDLARNRTRLDVVKEVVADFAEKRTEDNLALVIFAKRAYRVVPLTPDKQLLRTYLADVDVGVVDPDATAIGNALARSVDVLRSGRARSKVVILLTDGSNNTGSVPPLTAAEVALSKQVKVYTVGAGSTELRFARRYPVDEGLLTDIASKTGGRYFRAEDEDGLYAAYREIDRLEKTTIEKVLYRRYREHFPALLAAALASFLLSLLFEETVLKRAPA